MKGEQNSNKATNASNLRLITNNESNMPSLVSTLQRQCLGVLVSSLGQMFESADNALFKLAEQAKNNQEQAQYFDAMRTVRLEKESIMASFQRRIELSFSRSVRFLKAGIEPTLSTTFSDFGLVDEQQLELSIALDGIKKHLMAQCKQELRDLLLRYQVIVPAFEGKESDLPFSPEAIAEAMETACDKLDIGIKEKLIVLKLFERSVSDKVILLYRDLNLFLKEAGVISRLTDQDRYSGLPSGAAKSNSEKLGRSEDASLYGGKQSGDGMAMGSHHQQQHAHTAAFVPDAHQMVELPGHQQGSFFQVIRELLASGHNRVQPVTEQDQSQYGQISHRLGDDNGQSINLAPKDLVSLLSGLQSRAINTASGRASVIDVRSELAGTFDDKQLSIDKQEDDVIEIVTMLFNFILSDDSVPSKIKVHICRLQIPVLKVALLDHGFFAFPQHPARSLVNMLAKASIGWEKNETHHASQLHNKIIQIVDYVVDNFNDSVDVFTWSIDDFSAFMVESDKRSKKIEKRTRLSEEGRAKTEQVKTIVEQCFALLLDSNGHSEDLSRFFEDYYKKIMLVQALKHGFKSESWKKLTSILSILAWSYQEGLTKEQIAKKRNVTNKLIQELKKIAEDSGLLDIGFNNQVELIKQHLLAVPAQENTQGFGEIEPVKAKTININKILKKNQQDRLSSEKNVSIEVGTWVELHHDGQFQRCKLAAILSQYGRYIFVNSAGAKIADMFVKEVHQKIVSNDLKVLDDSALFDRALKSVITNLRDLKAANV